MIEILHKIVSVEFISPMPLRLAAFNFVATAGQTEFQLANVPLQVIICAVQGTLQNQIAGDFTVVGDLITFDQGIPLGYSVFGFYQY